MATVVNRVNKGLIQRVNAMTHHHIRGRPLSAASGAPVVSDVPSLQLQYSFIEMPPTE